VVSCDWLFFWTSTSLTSSDGDAAATGTLPLSPPQMPLNTSTSLPAADLGEGRQRRADQIDTLRQLARTSVRVHAIDDVRQDVERIGRRAPGCGEAAFDVLEEQAERLALLLQFLPAHLQQPLRRDRIRRLDHRIRLAGHRSHARLAASVSIRLWKCRKRRPSEQERLENALIDHGHGTSTHAFVVVPIEAGQRDVAQPFARRVEDHAQEGRQHRLVHAFGKRLRVVGVPLAVAFDAVSEGLVEEHARSPARVTWLLSHQG
jgi:hypothetical protein